MRSHLLPRRDLNMASSSKSSPSSNKLRAIDMLDQHINRRSQGKTRSATPPNSLPWLNSHLPIPSLVRPLNNDNNTSPTPKRRRIVQVEGSTTQELDMIPIQAESKCRTIEETSRGSPSSKSVAFSDKIESSPTQRSIMSSPIPPLTSRPFKSILRNCGEIQKTVSDLTYNRSPARYSSISKGSGNGVISGIDPGTLEYWVSGEVHSLLDFNNLGEFKRIITGGLELLEKPEDEYVSRRFEIYATFNNIVPISSSRRSNDTSEKKIMVLVDTLEKITSICLPQLISEQDKLLSKKSKKDPFVSRIYVQIVRFIGFILSNFTIMKHLNKRVQLQEKLKDFYSVSKAALVHENSNKVMLAAQISLLANENFGIYYLSREELVDILLAVTNTKEIQSTNLTCERLLLMKRFISKYPQIMIESVLKWLPIEVLPRIFVHDETHSLKILVTATSVLLDLLKKCLNNSQIQAEIYKCVEVSLVRDTVPKRLLAKILQDDQLQDTKLKLGDLLGMQIEYLILVKEEYKLAMDLWLAITGLVYNSRQHLIGMKKDEERRWLELNHICFKVGTPTARLLSLKVWRIVTYCVCAQIQTSPNEIDLQLITLLKVPFEYAKNHHSDPATREGLIYFLSGVIYATCSYASNSPQKFSFFWDNLISPIFVEHIHTSASGELKSATSRYLLKLLETGKRRQVLSSRKGSQIIKVIASVGTELSDIQGLPPKAIKENYEIITTLLLGGMKSNISDLETNVSMLSSLLNHLPINCVDYVHFKEFNDTAATFFSGKEGSELFSSSVCKLCCVISRSFAKLLFTDDKIFHEFSNKMLGLIGDGYERKINLLKDIVMTNKETISEISIVHKFLKSGDKVYRRYASNWMGSSLFYAAVTEEDLTLLLEVVKIVPTLPVIENVLHFCAISDHNLRICSLLDPATSEDEVLSNYVKIIISKEYTNFREEISSILKRELPKRESLFVNLLPFLIQRNLHDIVKHTIHESPHFLTHISDEYKPFVSLILPKDDMPLLLELCVTEPELVQLTILQWFLENEEFDLMFKVPSYLESIFFHKEPESEILPEKTVFLVNILDELYGRNLWKHLSIMVELCMDNHCTHHITDLFSKVGTEKSKLLTPNAVASMANKCGSLNSSLIGLIKEKYKTASVNYNREITKCLVSLDKFQIFSLCKSEFLDFFVSRSLGLPPDQQSCLEKTFQIFVESLFKYSKKLLMDVLRSFLSLVSDKRTEYLVSLGCCFARLIQTHGDSLIDITDFSSTLASLQELVAEASQTSIPHNRDISTVNPPSKISESNQELDNVEKSVQIPATQSFCGTSNSVTRLRVTNNAPGSSGKGSQVTYDAKKEQKFSNKQNSTNTEVKIKVESTGNISSRLQEPEDTSNERTSRKFRHADSTYSLDTDIKQIGPKNKSKSKPSIEERTPESGRASKESSNFVIEPRKMQASVIKDENLAPAETGVIQRQIKNKLSPKRQEKLSPSNSQSLNEDMDASVISEIRFPIFNSSRLTNESLVKLDTQKRETSSSEWVVSRQNGETLNNTIKDCSPETTDHEFSVQPEDRAAYSNLGSEKVTPSLRVHFPSRKARRLVYRLRGFSAEDLSNIPAEEKRNMRVELLDFMMQLEHDNGS